MRAIDPASRRIVSQLAASSTRLGRIALHLGALRGELARCAMKVGRECAGIWREVRRK